MAYDGSLIIKSLQYTEGDFMFWYWFVCHRQHTFVWAMTSKPLSRLLYFWQDWWPCPVNYMIRFWLIFVVTLTLNFHGQRQLYNILLMSVSMRENMKKNILIRFAIRRKTVSTRAAWSVNRTSGCLLMCSINVMGKAPSRQVNIWQKFRQGCISKAPGIWSISK